MSATAIQSLVTSTLSTFGGSALVIITAVIGIGLAFLIFNWGWRRITSIVDPLHSKGDFPRFGEKVGRRGNRFD